MKFTLSIFVLTCLIACTEKKQPKFIELIDETNLPHYSQIACKSKDNSIFIKVNNCFSDTLVFYSDNGCLSATNTAYFSKNSNGDFEFNAVGIGCFASVSKTDTICPSGSAIFALDKIRLMVNFERTPYLRLGYEYETSNKLINPTMATIFLGLDSISQSIFQLDTIIVKDKK
ncbi:MAG: hypothetical protein MUC59_05735 [Saprospiraceae bacterium]|jgi:hypothetical protein|nr:hypothetical protein [Saprospiraceae bacterium]